LEVIVFFVLTAGMVMLPFIPAIAEWRRKRDAEPLRVVRDSQVDVRHFANGFRKFIEGTFGSALKTCRESHKTERGNLEDGTPYLIIGKGAIPEFTDDLQQDEPYHQLILSYGDLRLSGNMMFATEIYADCPLR